MFLTKKIRWIIYSAITLVIMIGGFYLTATERPDRYTPRDAPDPSIFEAPEQASTSPGSDDEGSDDDSDVADEADDHGEPDSDRADQSDDEFEEQAGDEQRAGEASADESSDELEPEDGASWAIRMTGTVHDAYGLEVNYTREHRDGTGGSYWIIELEHDGNLEDAGQGAPTVPSTADFRSRRSKLESMLGSLPEAGDKVTIVTQSGLGTPPDSFGVHSIEYVDADGSQ